MNYIVKKRCIYCHGTGDWRGLYGKKQSNYLSPENKCLHCNGTGEEKQIFKNLCKYCGEPCSGYCCQNCFETCE